MLSSLALTQHVPAWARVNTRTSSLVRAALLITLGAGAVLNIVLAVAATVRPDEVRYGEAIIYEQAGRLLDGQPLYQVLDRPPLTVAAYTPMYYWCAALLRLAVGPGFGSGRTLSLFAGLVAAGLAGYLTWRRTATLWPAVTCVLLFLAVGMVGPIPWSGSYKEDVLAIALALACVALLDGRPTARRVCASAVLAGIAVLTKQTMLALPVTAAIWLLVQSGRRMAGLFAFIAGLVVLGPLLVLELTTRAMLTNVVFANLNPFSAQGVEYNVILLGLFQGCPLLCALAFCVVKRPSGRALAHDLVVLNWVASFAPVAGLAKEGADYNYWQLLAAMTSIVVAWALWEWRRRPWGSIAAAALLSSALASFVIVASASARDLQVLRDGSRRSEFADLVESVRTAPGAVFADPLDVSVLGGKSIALEPVIYRLFAQSGQWDPTPMVDQICGRKVSMLVLGYPLGSAHDGGQASHQWPAPVLEAFRTTMRLRATVAVGTSERYVYVPDSTGSPCAAEDTIA